MIVTISQLSKNCYRLQWSIFLATCLVQTLLLGANLYRNTVHMRDHPTIMRLVMPIYLLVHFRVYSTDKLLSNIQTVSNILLKNIPLPSNVFTWYANYYSTTNNKGVRILVALQAKHLKNLPINLELENGRSTPGCLGVQSAIRQSLLRRLVAHWWNKYASYV